MCGPPIGCNRHSPKAPYGPSFASKSCQANGRRSRYVHGDYRFIPARAGNTFWTTNFPPNGWGCKCRVRQVTRRERGRLLEREPDRYRTDAPELPEREWANPATGEVRTVPAGVDPGWDYNPGRHRTLGIHRRDAERSEAVLAGRALETVPAPERERLVRRRIGQLLDAPAFRRFVNRPRAVAAPRREARPEFVDAVPVAVAPARLREAAEASRALVYLPENIADKQWRRHGPGQKRPTTSRTVPLAWWADIRAILESIVPAPAAGRAVGLRRRRAQAPLGGEARAGRGARRHLVSSADNVEMKRPRGPKAARSLTARRRHPIPPEFMPRRQEARFRGSTARRAPFNARSSGLSNWNNRPGCRAVESRSIAQPPRRVGPAEHRPHAAQEPQSAYRSAAQSVRAPQREHRLAQCRRRVGLGGYCLALAPRRPERPRRRGRRAAPAVHPRSPARAGNTEGVSPGGRNLPAEHAEASLA